MKTQTFKITPLINLSSYAYRNRKEDKGRKRCIESYYIERKENYSYIKDCQSSLKI